MSIPLFYPPCEYVTSLDAFLKPDVVQTSLVDVCRNLNIPCRATGLGETKPLFFSVADSHRIICSVEPPRQVLVILPSCVRAKNIERWVLASLAFAVFDPAARESIRGLSWTRIKPNGRPRSKTPPLTNKERQRRYREKQKAVTPLK